MNNALKTVFNMKFEGVIAAYLSLKSVNECLIEDELVFEERCFSNNGWGI